MIRLLNPERLWTRKEVLAKPSPVPREPGVYAWYFREIPPNVPVVNCHIYGSNTLLYVGIAPKEREPPSKSTILDRIPYHYRGDAEGSTLRRTLGCLLSERLGIQLQPVGSGKRFTFADGEQILSQWFEDNAFVAWVVDPKPWILEKTAIGEVSLPLNLDMNETHPFHQTLSQLRKSAKESARKLPISPKQRSR